MALQGPKKIPFLSERSETNKLEWRRKIILFSFFLGISIIIWTLNALSKNYTTVIKYPIIYTRFPEQKMLISDLPEHLQLRVNAHGYRLLSYKFVSRPVPITFQVSSYAMNNLGGDSTRFYMLTRYAREQIDKQLPEELQLLDIAPDTLVFQFANESERMMAVLPSISYQLAKDFTTVGGIKVSPDTIRVSGPDIYLDTLSSIRTRFLDLGSIEKSFRKDIELEKYKWFSYNVDKVECSIELEKMTEIQLKVPIRIEGLPDSLRIQTFPQSVMVTGRVGLSNYDRVVSESFWVEVSFEEAILNKNRLQVQVKSAPEFIEALDFYPQTVEYLLSVK